MGNTGNRDDAAKARDSCHGGGVEWPVVLAGSTCDSLDILYDEADHHLPLEPMLADVTR